MSDFTIGPEEEARIGQQGILPRSIKNRSLDNLTLGGIANTNGTLTINDSTGTARVTADKTGITVTNGSITIKNATNTTIIDATGVNSLNNFESGGVVGSGATQDITSTSYVDINNMTITTSNFTRSAQVFMMYTGLIQVNSTDGVSNFTGTGIIRFNVDGSEPSNDTAFQRLATRNSTYADNVEYYTSTIHHFMTLGTGTHTIKMQGEVINNSGLTKMSVFNAQRLTYFVLGK